MGLGKLVRAELSLSISFLKSNRGLFVLWVLWPYLTVLVLYALGTAYGSLEEMKSSLGVDDPILYLFAASTIAFSASGLIDVVSGRVAWYRWVGVLPYVSLAPYRLGVYLAVGGFISALFEIAFNYLAVLPGAIIYSGLHGFAGLTAVLIVLILGGLPLISLAVAVGFLTLILKQESNVASFLNPLLLLLGGVFYPVSILPRVLQELSRIVPVTYIVEAARIAATFSEGPGRALYYAAYTLGALAIAYNIAGLWVAARGEDRARREGVI